MTFRSQDCSLSATMGKTWNSFLVLISSLLSQPSLVSSQCHNFLDCVTACPPERHTCRDHTVDNFGVLMVSAGQTVRRGLSLESFHRASRSLGPRPCERQSTHIYWRVCVCAHVRTNMCMCKREKEVELSSPTEEANPYLHVWVRICFFHFKVDSDLRLSKPHL